MYIDVWKRIYSEASVIIKTILERVFADAQPQQRWLKGVSSLVLANAMVCTAENNFIIIYFNFEARFKFGGTAQKLIEGAVQCHNILSHVSDLFQV